MQQRWVLLDVETLSYIESFEIRDCKHEVGPDTYGADLILVLSPNIMDACRFKDREFAENVRNFLASDGWNLAVKEFHMSGPMV